MEAVESRHVAIQKIERQVIELAQLFEDMNVQVLQQEPVVTQINQQSEVVHENVNQANTQLDGAISKARAANRKKWYCLGIACKLSFYTGLNTFTEHSSTHHNNHRHHRGHCGQSRGSLSKQLWDVEWIIELSGGADSGF
jgi:hypothetical protein